MLINNIDFIIRPDYSHNAFLPFSEINRVHNTILIPESININFKSGDKVLIVNNNKQKFFQTIVFEPNKITLNKKIYNCYHIAPGLNVTHNPLIDNPIYTIVYQQQELKTDLFLDYMNNNCKLIIGLLILKHNYYDHFNNNDNIQLFIDNKIYLGVLNTKLQKFNLYTAKKTVTILDIINNKNEDLLYYLNSSKNIQFDFFIRSLDTKSNNNKGSITIKTKDNTIFDIICEKIDLSSKYEFKNNKNYVHIKNLDKGQYKITILVDNYDIYNTILSVDGYNNRNRSKIQKIKI